jgi:hypothetical protein
LRTRSSKRRCHPAPASRATRISSCRIWCCGFESSVIDTFTEHQRVAQKRVRSLMWRFYADLETYRINPTPRRRRQLRARFNRIFCRRTGFVTLDRLLARLHANKAELLEVLDRPDIPLHTLRTRHPLSRDQAKAQRWHPRRWRTGLSRRLPWTGQDLCQIGGSPSRIISAAASASLASRPSSLSPILSVAAASPRSFNARGLAPLTCAVEGCCSIQLS